MEEEAYDPPDGEPYRTHDLIRFSLGKVTVELECEGAEKIAEKLIAANEQETTT